MVAAARQLYGWLRDADERGLDTLVAVLPPPVGLGHAIRDRLLKAAGKG
ncbi:MAG: Sua5 family C-terminal domain-containing protein [Ilumatobacteraceae bacterium]